MHLRLEPLILLLKYTRLNFQAEGFIFLSLSVHHSLLLLLTFLTAFFTQIYLYKHFTLNGADRVSDLSIAWQGHHNTGPTYSSYRFANNRMIIFFHTH